MPYRALDLSSRWRGRLTVALAALLLTSAWLVVSPARSLAACGNPVACENQLPGDPPSDWQVSGIGDSTIQGYATQFSVNAGQTESFKIKTPSSAYHLDILRLGYYGGNGARIIASNIKPTATLPQTQPACLTDSSTGLIDCGNWSVSASWTVPSTAVSGMYIAHLVRDDAQDKGGESQIPFVVRNDSSHSDVVLATSDATWEAYNAYGGNSLYTCTVACPPGNPLGYKGAYAVSYNRPFDGAFTTDGGASYLYYAEYQMIYWLEENGYDVSYVGDSDLDSNPALLQNHKLFISSGHDEYWSGNEYQGLKAALANGVNLAFFSGNEMFWKTRWANSGDGSNTPYRTLITYKETHFNAPTDPQDPPTWTGAWADPRFSPPADGGIPANSLTGQEFLVNSGSGDITVPSQYSKLRFWRNTAVANLSSGQSLTLAPGCSTLGYEWDADPDNGFRPPGEIEMSSTTLSNVQPFTDYGSTTGTGTETHHLVLYRAPSGALVFGAGTVQWAWGLDEVNAWSNAGAPCSTPDRNVQQATVNLFADMGVQPTTLLSGLTPATQSTNTTPPSSSITSPSAGANFNDGAAATITGTATSANGVVAGVEVSTDSGNTWHPATLTTADGPSVNWTYNWTAQGNPSTRIMSRATDDSGNIEAPSGGVSVNVACPCSVWGSSTPGGATDGQDGSAITVGMKFTSDQFGTINAIRFYKVTANTGTHIGSLWTASGKLLASVTFTNETASGWQQANLSSPVTIMPNTTYVVSYFAPNGHYAATDNYFYPAPAPTPLGGATTNNPPLHAVMNSASPNGVFTYGSSSQFPTDTFQSENYWVDVQFNAAPAPGQATGVQATAGNGVAYVTWTAPSSGGAPTSYIVTPYINGAAQTPTTVSGLPAPTGAAVTGLSAGTSYTFTVTAANPNGSGPPSAPSNAVTPSAGSSTPAFVQQVAAHGLGTSLSVTPTTNLTVGNRLVVVAGMWSSSNATAASVTDSAGDTFTELSHFTASDGTEMSVWSAPILAGGGTAPKVTLTPTGSADLGIAVSEYSGLSPVSDATVVDQQVHATGTTGAAATVSSGATAATTASNELAVGAYVDSGFGDTLTAGTGFTQRTNVSPTGDIELLTEDQLQASAGATPRATVGTGGSTPWLMETIVFKGQGSAPPSAPGAPSNVSATPGNGSASVSWTAPPNNGSPITSYTITPYVNGSPQLPTTITGSPPATNATITGLTNGTTYTFTVTATNTIGTGQASSPSNAVTPTAPTAPAAPTGVTATAGNGNATVSWTAPANGGSTITSYTITPYIGTTAQATTTITGTPPATSTTITGLTNGTTYTFTVTATNAVGTGPESNPSNAVTPTGPTAPGAPTAVSATAGLNSATVSWTAPANGGSTITSYTITPYIGTTAQAATTITGTPPATSTTITGLAGGTSYTFTVTATNAIGTGPASNPSNAVTPTSPTAPAAPTGVTATAGNGNATVSWTAPSNGGSTITSYTITPYIGTTAQAATTITGTPPATSTTITGLTNGTTYTFTVTATNTIGTGPASNSSNAVTPSAVTPTFVQQVTAHSTNVTTQAVTPANNVSAGNRLVVLVGVWSGGNATAKSVTDAAGNTYTEVLHFTASEGTEESVWTAPITAGGGTKPKITVTPTARADVGVAALEYSGLSTAAGAGVVDQIAKNTGTTGGTAASVSSGPTAPVSAANELAMGFYIDSGFNDTLTAGTGFTSRSNVSKASNMELLAEDQIPALGATPNASAGTGKSTTWLMATVVFKHA